MTPACLQGRCNAGRAICPNPGACQTAAALPPLLAWIRRECIARTQLRRWYLTNRKAGFSRSRALVLAWKTTNPIKAAP